MGEPVIYDVAGNGAGNNGDGDPCPREVDGLEALGY